LGSSKVYAQTAGNYVFQFLNTANSARVAAYGSNFLPIDDDDLDLVYANPSLISSKLHHNLSINYLNYFSGVNAGVLSYAHDFKKIGTLAATIQFMNYGEFIENNQAGENIGRFFAADYGFIIGWSKPLAEHWRIGANLKNIYSVLDHYTSYGLAADVALTYSDRDDQLASSIIFKNMGRQITSYNGEQNEPIPFQIQWGIAKKFEHAPFRLIFLLNDLQTWNLRYEDPNEANQTSFFNENQNEPAPLAQFGDNALRHLVMGVEFLPGKGNFMLRLGYNYRRQQEMQIASRTAMTGFAFGLGFKVYKLKISYTRATYHLAGASNTIGIGTNFSDLFTSTSTVETPAGL
jgi:nitrous oxide reductase accessory protein NosL